MTITRLILLISALALVGVAINLVRQPAPVADGTTWIENAGDAAHATIEPTRWFDEPNCWSEFKNTDGKTVSIYSPAQVYENWKDGLDRKLVDDGEKVTVYAHDQNGTAMTRTWHRTEAACKAAMEAEKKKTDDDNKWLNKYR